MKKGIIALMLLSPAAFAQSPPTAADYTTQALSQKLMVEINQNLQLSSALLAAQDKIKELQGVVDAAKPAPAK
jgi:hypothetical protein